MQIEYRDGLLFTSIEIVYQGRSKVIHNMVIDTGAAKTVISQNAVEDIHLRVEMGDRIVAYYGIGGKEYAFTKKLDPESVTEVYQKCWETQSCRDFDSISNVHLLGEEPRVQYFVD
ncbi:aspartyl protease family protein [Anoxybacillus geothermalis]|nr:aspartyl protease family protein [Anoxybacillus geothermalis]